MLSPKDIDALAALSRISLSAEEKEHLRNDFASILGYVEQINTVSASLSSERKAGVLRNVLRADDSPHESGIFTETLISATPKREGDYLKVKKIL